MSVSSAVFCRAHDRDRQTNRQTDHAIPSVTIGRVYVFITAMQPKKVIIGCIYGFL